MDEDGERKTLEALYGTELYDEIIRLKDLYARLDKDEKRFCDRFGIHCKKKCGKCCERFTPDITKAEAEYLAFGLIAEGRDGDTLAILSEKKNGEITCPLYSFEDEEHHCTVYKWRPLICRLFGASASEDKNGRPVFKNCRWNDAASPVTTENLESHREDVVEMGTYGNLLEEEEEETPETEMLPVALEKAIGKVRLILELEEEEKENK